MDSSGPSDRADLTRPQSGEAVDIVVYWRPRCPFCAVLRHRLQKARVATVERDIWADPDAAAFVRRHAGGNETVPTVEVAGTVLVNPSLRAVLDAAQQAGYVLPGPPPKWWHR